MRAVLVPPLVPSGGSPLAPACLMFAAVCLDASPPSSHHLVLGCVPPPSACPRLVPLLRFAPPSMSVPMSSRPIASRYPPRLIDTTDGAIRRCCGGSLGSACLPLGSPSHPCVRHRMATGLGSCSRPMSIIGAACYPLARTIRFPRRPSSHRLSPRSLDTGDGAVVLSLPWLLACAARSLLPFDFACGRFARVLCIAAAVVVLLAWVSYYVCCRWGT